MAKKTDATAPPKAKKAAATAGAKKVTKMKIAHAEDEPNGQEPLSDFQTPATGRVDGYVAPEFTEPAPNVSDVPQPMQEKGIKINKAKYDKENHLSVNYERIKTDSFESGSLDSDAIIHDDLLHAFKALDVHVATWGGQYNEQGKIDTENVKCVGVSIKTGKIHGVALIGKRTMEGKNMNIVPPFLRLDDSSPYPLWEEVETCVDKVIAEVKEYMNGKHKVMQGTFEFPVEHHGEIHPAPTQENMFPPVPDADNDPFELAR